MNRKGYTLVELMIGVAVMSILTVGFATFLRGINKATVKAQNSAFAQENVREALDKLEVAVICANEITIASATFVEFICDIDETPGYDRKALTIHGLPRYLDPDRDGDAYALMPSSAQWQVGFNLNDDDEDGDGNVDLKKRLYLSSGTLWLDLSINGAAWGGGEKRPLLTHVSTFTISYFGNKANALGKQIDLDGDGVVTASEIDAAVPPTGQGNNNGLLDTPGELIYLTQLHFNLGWSPNGKAASVYQAETDVYPPLLPLKPGSL